MSFNQWFNDRLPVAQVVKDHLTEYYAPKNFNFWYFFGGLALVVLILQIVTGVPAGDELQTGCRPGICFR